MITLVGTGDHLSSRVRSWLLRGLLRWFLGRRLRRCLGGDITRLDAVGAVPASRTQNSRSRNVLDSSQHFVAASPVSISKSMWQYAWFPTGESGW